MELTYEDALILLAYSMAAADGHIGDDEDAAIEKGLQAQQVHVLPARRQALRELAATSRPSNLMGPICEAIPVDQRMDAVRMVIDVVWADDRFRGDEMAQVLQLADELQLDRQAMGRLIQART